MNKYPSLERFSKSIGIPPEDLVQAFEIEKKFHETILTEASREERLKLYSQVYSSVHAIYQKNTLLHLVEGSRPKLKSRKARLFNKEINNKSILEVGCGQGTFLQTLANSGANTKLYGLDVTIPDKEITNKFPNIKFIAADVTQFKVDQKFDVVYSNHVYEHISPADLSLHLTSINNALIENGTLIISAPNRLFGPSDVTRIIDFSYTNKVNAMGTHLNETTYNEIIDVLQQHGFSNFRTTFPSIVIRHLVPNFRMSPSILCKIENAKNMISLLHKIKYRGTCVFKLEVTIVCNKQQ